MFKLASLPNTDQIQHVLPLMQEGLERLQKSYLEQTVLADQLPLRQQQILHASKPFLDDSEDLQGLHDILKTNVEMQQETMSLLAAVQSFARKYIIAFEKGLVSATVPDKLFSLAANIMAHLGSPINQVIKESASEISKHLDTGN